MPTIENILYFELNAFTIIILVLIFFNVYHRAEKLLVDQKLFITGIGMVVLLIILDSISWFLDGKPGSFARDLNIATMVLSFALRPVLSLLWYFYVDFYIFRNTKRLKKILIPMLIPVALNLVLSVWSAFSDVLFYIDANNVYHQGKLFAVMALISIFYFAYAMVFTQLKQKLIPKQGYIPLAVFAIPPFIGGIIQIIFFGVSLIFIGATISMLVIFLTTQNNMLYTDHLTGLYNRRQLDKYVQQREHSTDSIMFAGLMVDVDTFKDINDSFGHDIGDQALVNTAEILRKTFRKNDFIARYGGDEFIVIMAVRGRDDLSKAVERLNNNITKFNEQRGAPYTISLSIGYDCYSEQKEGTLKDFIKHLDDLMYHQKQSKLNRGLDQPVC